MFEQTAAVDPAGFLAAATEQVAKLPSQLWRTGNEGFAQIAAAMDALAVQLDCARVGWSRGPDSRGGGPVAQRIGC